MFTSIEDGLSRIIDDGDFWIVQDRMSRFNLFEALGAVTGELRHSNFLAHLLSPGRPHGLGSLPLEALLRRVLESMPPAQRPVSTLELIVGDLDGAVVHRERDGIDLLIEVDALELVVVIENKVRAKAAAGQLKRYRDIVEARYPSKRKLLVFLTPEGHASNEAGYQALSYIALAEIFEKIVAARPDGEASTLIVRHYVDMLRKNIVEDEHLRSLAAKLYERHAEAFDFIFASRPRTTGLIGVIAQQVRSCEGLLVDSEGVSILRFSPETWDANLAFRTDAAEWSRTGRGILFEVKTYTNKPGRVNVSVIIGPGDQERRRMIYEAARARSDVFIGLVKPMGVKWVTIFSRDLLTAERAATMSAEQQANNLRLAWSDFQGGALPILIEAVLAIDAEVAGSAR
jgi:hypothetical protein